MDGEVSGGFDRNERGRGFSKGGRGGGGFRGGRGGGGFRGGRDGGGFRGGRDGGGFRGGRDGGGFRGGRGGGGFRGGRGGGFRGGRSGGGFRGGRSGGGGFRGGKPGRGRGGFRGGKKVVIVPHRHEGVFIARGAQDSLLTKNLTPGLTIYNEKLIKADDENSEKIEYRVWNPFRSKLAAAIMAGIENIYIKPGSKVLYLGAASGTTVSHVSDLVGPEGMVFAVEFSLRSGRDLLINVTKRSNVAPIIEDARMPLRYRMLIVEMCDVIFSDVAQPDQARILELNAKYYLKNNGHYLLSLKANCIDSTAAPEAVVANEIEKLRKYNLKPLESISLEPYERDHTMVVGVYRPKNVSTNGQV